MKTLILAILSSLTFQAPAMASAVDQRAYQSLLAQRSTLSASGGYDGQIQSLDEVLKLALTVPTNLKTEINTHCVMSPAGLACETIINQVAKKSGINSSEATTILNYKIDASAGKFIVADPVTFMLAD